MYTKLHVGQSKLLQKSTRAQLFSAKKYWSTAIKRQNNTGAQLLREKNTRAQLFSGKKYWGTAILRQNNTGAQLFRAKNTRAQESGEGICMTLTRQMFARRTPSAKEHSLALLTHLTYYLCGRHKMNNSYYL